MAGQGMMDWLGIKVPFIYGKVTIDTGTSASSQPGSNKSTVSVDLWFRGDYPQDQRDAGAMKPDERQKLFESAVYPDRDAQGKLIVKFTEGRENGRLTAQYELDWAWLQFFQEYTPMDGQDGMGNPATSDYNQLIHCRWVNIPERDQHKVSVSA